jgi:membrane dipeptidase
LLAGGVAGGVALAAGGTRRFLRDEQAPLGFTPDPDFLARANALLDRVAAVDIHAHPGRTFFRDAEDLSLSVRLFSLKGTRESEAIDDMRAGKLAAASFAAVADFQVLSFSKANGLFAARPFDEGEAWTSYQRQIANLKALTERLPLRSALEPDDILQARAAGRIAALWTTEGADFLEGDLSRLATLHADGIRSVTIVHYRDSEVGDIQTGSAPHGGLTPFGADVVREMGRLGMIVDVAHSSEATALRAVEVAERPVMCSHTHLQGDPIQHPRFISERLARAIAERGGVIGAWPAGLGITTFEQFIDRIFALVEKLGVDHVALGTDMDANYKPVMDNYRQLPLLVSELLRRGMGEPAVTAFLSGNFLRVFTTVRAGRERVTA